MTGWDVARWVCLRCDKSSDLCECPRPPLPLVTAVYVRPCLACSHPLLAGVDEMCPICGEKVDDD